MSKYIPAERLVAVVCTLLAIELLLTGLQTLSLMLQIQLLTRALSGAEISDTEASINDLRIQAISVAAVLMAATCGIVFLRFLGRANHNARALGADGISATPGWTIGYFFVPVINLWRPYQILQEIWKASAPEPGDWKTRAGSSLIGWWWGLRLLDNVANRVVLRMTWQPSGDAPSLENLINQTWTTIGVQGLDAVVLVLSFLLIQQLHQRQLARREVIGEPAEVQCPECGEPLGQELLFEVTCPLCGAVVQPQTA